MASCTRIENSLQAYIDGELGDSDRVILEQHVAECRACAENLRRQQRANAVVFEAFALDRLRTSLRARVLENLPEMESVQEDIESVNWRAKHPGPWYTRTAQFVPAAALAVLVIVAFVLQHYWPSSSTSTEKIGLVSFTHGIIKRSEENATARNAVNLNDYVQCNDRFETGAQASMMLSITGPTHLKAAGDSSFKVVDSRRIQLENGTIWVDVGHDGSLFKVTTPGGVITVFGTIFSVQVKNAITTVTVERGLVQVENGTNFCRLEGGQQVTISTQGLSAPIEVDAAAIHAWAKPISPDADSEALFEDAVLPKSEATELPGRVAFFVDTSQNGKSWDVTAIRVYWQPDQIATGHCGYDVYVSSGNGTPIFKAFIDGSVFADKRSSSYEIPVPNGPIRGVMSLIVRLVPNRVSGDIVNNTLDVKAIAVKP
ncbi:MAG: FecR domain-containing protein [Candidatus Hydrogenedentes bacterium]|nr:FecR domain-containing protein [Candidatus Hydrogenedentota bacterium]